MIDAAQSVLMPVPTPSRETEPFWAAVNEERLVMPRCEACGTYFFPPALACPNCSATTIAWTPVSGRGSVFSFVVYHRVYHPAFKDKVPYVVAVIALEEGPRLISGIVGIPPSDVRCDMPVEVRFEEVRDGIRIPKFAPATPSVPAGA
jgi:uncharacterized OB-fold protein